MKRYNKLFTIGNTGFHLISMIDHNYEIFLTKLQRELPDKCYLAIVDVDGISDIDNLYELFVDAFHFPDYFGYNWDAFNECMNDLSWLNSDSYILIINNLDKLKLNENNLRIFLRILKEVAEEWMKGRTFNPSFITQPTPFHIVFTVSLHHLDNITKLLNEVGIKHIDML